MASGLIITACEANRKPICAEVQIGGLGNFSHLVSKFGDSVYSDFESAGHIVSQIGYGAMTTPDGEVVYCAGKKEATSEAHEGFHVKTKEYKLRSKEFIDPARGYLLMAQESAATAVQEYFNLQNCEDAEKEIITSAVNTKRKFGKETYNLVRKGQLEQITDAEIEKFSQRSFIKHRTKNWASMMVDMTYFGLLDPCMAILERYGLEQGQQEMFGLLRDLKDDSTADTFFKQLAKKSKKVIIKSKPIREGLVCKGIFEYKQDGNNYLRSIFSGPIGIMPEMFIQMKNKLLESYGAELNKLGEPWMNVWAKEIITNGFE